MTLQQIREIAQRYQRRLDQITPPKTKSEEYERDMLIFDIGTLNRELKKRDLGREFIVD
jgi:hypothetical protein